MEKQFKIIVEKHPDGYAESSNDKEFDIADNTHTGWHIQT